MSATPMPLEPWLQELVDLWVLTPLEADQMQDFWRLLPDNAPQELPEHLHPAFRKVSLQQYLDETATRH
jgi:hypothetical protein